MKNLILFTLLIFFSTTVFGNDSIVEIAGVYYNTRNKEVVEFNNDAKQYSNSRFPTIDPLSEKYYHISPYVYCADNPIKYIDPDGRDFMIANAPRRVLIAGHMAMLLQDKGGNWHFATMGATDAGIDAIVGRVDALMGIESLGTTDKETAMSKISSTYTQFTEFETSNSMDDAIFNAATEISEKINTNDKKYNAIFYNCSDVVIETIEKGIGVKLSSGTVLPNSAFKDIEKNKEKIQEKINMKVFFEQILQRARDIHNNKDKDENK